MLRGGVRGGGARQAKQGIAPSISLHLFLNSLNLYAVIEINEENDIYLTVKNSI